MHECEGRGSSLADVEEADVGVQDVVVVSISDDLVAGGRVPY